MYSWILVLVVLMAGGGNGGKRRRSSARAHEEQPEEEVGSEYNPGDDSDRESPEEEDWEAVASTAEIRTKKKEQDRGKGKSKGKGKEREPELPREQQTYVRGRKRSGGISIPGTGEDSPPRASIDSRRVRMYASKQCVGERKVGVVNLCEKVPGFRALFESGNLHEICDFPEQGGYGIELVREFYMRAGNLIETEGGPFSFTTSVRGIQLLITPDIVGNVLEMPAWTGGIDYMHAGFDSGDDWQRVLNTLCVPGAVDNVNAVMSKHLRLEYRFLNFVVCYNIMPLANTKVIRWDRVLYMYLLGRPDIVEARNINLNIPFLIWKRMAREIKTANQKDRLPYPLLIMRILRFHEVNVECSSYERSLGPISDATISKSHVQLHGHSPPHPEAPAAASPPAAAASDTEASISSVYREQQRLSGEFERQGAVQAQLQADVTKLKRRQGRISRYLRLLCEKMGCGSSELPSPETDSD